MYIHSMSRAKGSDSPIPDAPAPDAKHFVTGAPPSDLASNIQVLYFNICKTNF